MPEGDMEKDSLQVTVPLSGEQPPTQRREHQLSTMRPDELCSLREDANEVQWQEVRFVNVEFERRPGRFDAVEPPTRTLLEPWSSSLCEP